MTERYLDILLQDMDDFAKHLQPQRVSETQQATCHPVAGPSWSSLELDLFHRAISRHSKLRPDLIAREIVTKTVVQVCIYINALEEGLPKLMRAESALVTAGRLSLWFKRRSASKSRPQRQKRLFLADSSEEEAERPEDDHERQMDEHQEQEPGAHSRQGTDHSQDQLPCLGDLKKQRLKSLPAAKEMSQQWIQYEEKAAALLSQKVSAAESRMYAADTHQKTVTGPNGSEALLTNTELRAAALLTSSVPIPYDEQVTATMVFLRYASNVSPSSLADNANLILDNIPDSIVLQTFTWEELTEQLCYDLKHGVSSKAKMYFAFCQVHPGIVPSRRARDRARLAWRAIELGYLLPLLPEDEPVINGNELPASQPAMRLKVWTFNPSSNTSGQPQSVQAKPDTGPSGEGSMRLCWADSLAIEDAAGTPQPQLEAIRARATRARNILAEARSSFFARALASLTPEDLRDLHHAWVVLGATRKNRQYLQGTSTAVPRNDTMPGAEGFEADSRDASAAPPTASRHSSLSTPQAPGPADTDESQSRLRRHKQGRFFYRGQDMGIDLSGLAKDEARKVRQRVRTYAARHGIEAALQNLGPDGRTKQKPHEQTQGEEAIVVNQGPFIYQGRDMGIDLSGLSRKAAKRIKQRVRSYANNHGIEAALLNLGPDGRVKPERPVEARDASGDANDVGKEAQGHKGEAGAQPQSPKKEEPAHSLPSRISRGFFKIFLEAIASEMPSDNDGGLSRLSAYDPVTIDSSTARTASLFHLKALSKVLEAPPDVPSPLQSPSAYRREPWGNEPLSTPLSEMEAPTSISFQTLQTLESHIRSFVTEVMLRVINILEPYQLFTEGDTVSAPRVSGNLIRAAVARMNYPSMPFEANMSSFRFDDKDEEAEKEGDEETGEKHERLLLIEEVAAKNARLDPPVDHLDLAEEAEDGDVDLNDGVTDDDEGSDGDEVTPDWTVSFEPDGSPRIFPFEDDDDIDVEDLELVTEPSDFTLSDAFLSSEPEEKNESASGTEDMEELDLMEDELEAALEEHDEDESRAENEKLRKIIGEGEHAGAKRRRLSRSLAR